MNEKQELIMETLLYLEEHLQETISLQSVAEAMQYSPYYLHRSFKQLCGMRMHDYVKRRKISEAARRLCETDASVLDIAMSYGYESSQAFSKAFKQLYKMTCTQFRKEHCCYPLQHPLQMHELNSIVSRDVDLQFQLAGDADRALWMRLMRQAVDFFPFLEESSYQEQLLHCMKQKEAFLVFLEKTPVAAIQLQLQTGQLDVLALHPQMRKPNIMEQLVEWMLCTCNEHADLTITCFRAKDKADTGYRRMLLEAGFVCGEELVEFGYPVQRLNYQRCRDV